MFRNDIWELVPHTGAMNIMSWTWPYIYSKWVSVIKFAFGSRKSLVGMY